VATKEFGGRMTPSPGADAQGAEDEVQSRSPGIDADAVPRLREGRELRFEDAQLFAHDEGACVDHASDRRVDLVPQWFDLAVQVQERNFAGI
jgi:hypothetical protein